MSPSSGVSRDQQGIIYTLFNSCTGQVILSSLRKADTFLSRSLGLLNRYALDADEGLWIEPCRAVHSFGMRFPIDVLFIDASGRIVGVVQDFEPMRLSRYYAAACGIIELQAGAAAFHNLALGERLSMRPKIGSFLPG